MGFDFAHLLTLLQSTDIMAAIIDIAGLAALIVGGMDPEVAGVHQALSVCGMPQATRNRFVIEGFVQLAEFRDYHAKDLDSVVSTMQKRPANIRVQVGIMALKNLKALAFWVRDNGRRGLPSASTAFTVAVLHSTRDRMATEGSLLGDRESDISLGKVNPKKFKQSKLELLNHLKSRLGCTGVPLAYVVRDNTLDPATAVDDNERMMMQAPLAGVSYNRDNKDVYTKMESWTIATDAWTWFQEGTKNDGRSAFEAVVKVWVISIRRCLQRKRL
jgi:hypothetical protein